VVVSWSETSEERRVKPKLAKETIGTASDDFGLAFASSSLWGKFGGLCACGATFSYILPLLSYLLNRLFPRTGLKRKDFQEIARLALGAGGPRFKSGRPDQNISRIFFSFIKSSFHPQLRCGILPGRRSGFASRLISKTSLHADYAKTRVGRSAIQKLLNRSKLSARHLASMGRIMGTLRICRLIELWRNESMSASQDSDRSAVLPIAFSLVQ